MREKELFSFISELKKDEQKEKDRAVMKESTSYKLNKIKQVKESAREVCLDTLISKIYKDAIPMDEPTKDLISDDLDAEISDYIRAKQPKGTVYYVKEAIKRGSKPAKEMLEAVDKMLTDHFRETALNIKDVDAYDITFDIKDPETEEKLNEISSTMQYDELSDAIKNNVKIAANAEIKRVKDERQKIKDLEEELKSDENVTNESAINFELQKRGIVKPGTKLYQPSLFEGVMINKSNLIKESGLDIPAESVNQLAFVETTKEMTKLFTLKSLMLESFTNDETRKLANRYATMKESVDARSFKNRIQTLLEKVQ